MTHLDSLHNGFRERYISHAELSQQVQAWAEAYPEVVRLQSLMTTENGREQWLLTIGRQPDRVRPAVWVDGNMHATELAGCSVALAIAEDVIRLHVEPDRAPDHLPEHLHERVRDTLVHVMPRVSPDGAQYVLDNGRWLRSVTRDCRLHRHDMRWRLEDVDGDGLSLQMRQEHPAGDFVASSEVPGLLLPRRVEDPPPYYRIYPEGHIENWDGHAVPPFEMLPNSDTDLNRNFPYSWEPESSQVGAGAFPGSAPETRSIVEFADRNPNLYAWLNLHTFGGCFIRPLGHQPDNKMNQKDLALYRQLGAWAQELTRYPMVSGFEEFTYEPDKPIHGDLSDWAFHHRGCISMVCELWDLFHQIGMKRKKRFVEHYGGMTREEMVALARWDAERNRGRCMRPWRSFEHPQLGPVEVGGVDVRFGFWNPPPEMLGEVCSSMAAFWLRVTALMPRLQVSVDSEALGGGHHRLAITVENDGYLSTEGLQSTAGLAHIEPLEAQIKGAQPERLKLGHLAGWGRGLEAGGESLFFQRSRGVDASRTVHAVVSGPATIRVGSCRTGWVEREWSPEESQ